MYQVPATTTSSDTADTAVAVLDALTVAFDTMTPQVQRAAQHVLDNPGDVAVSSMRSLAEAAGVKPNTLVRMARAVGFGGYDEFRDPFRREASETAPSFPDRARWLQSINEGGRHGALFASMAEAHLNNIETLFAELDVDDLKGAADLIAGARRANVLGVGTAKPLADNFTYVASMALDNFTAIPTIGIAIDDVARMTPDDVLVALTFSPYRVEIVEAVNMAVDLGVPVVAVSDSRTSPIVLRSTYGFSVPTESPFPFSSSVAATALLETLLAFAVADSATDVAAAIDEFHRNRSRAGIYAE